MRRFITVTSLAATGLLLSSCGAMNSLKSGAMGGVSAVGSGFSKAGKSVGNGFGAMADAATSPFRPGLPVVEARQEDLKELPSGHDQALAYQKEQQRRRGWWIFGGAVDFEEPSLPDSPVGADAGLLPPIE
ncbi:MAG: hypothetical protein ACPG4K_15135 [Haloferula sp.]